MTSLEYVAQIVSYVLVCAIVAYLGHSIFSPDLDGIGFTIVYMLVTRGSLTKETSAEINANLIVDICFIAPFFAVMMVVAKYLQE